MSSRAAPATLHSFNEAYLYLCVTPCGVCGGSLDERTARMHFDADGRVLTLEGACLRCESTQTNEFDVSGLDPIAVLEAKSAGALTPPWDAADQKLSDSELPSAVIDVAGWLLAFTAVSEQARSEAAQARDAQRRGRARRMRQVAAACLDEAVKFYEQDNELPPDDAFFSEAAHQQFWERPQLFARSYLAELQFTLSRA